MFDYISDIHLFTPDIILKGQSSNVLVVAGDIVELSFLLEYPKELLNSFFIVTSEYSKVITVLGNHEYYASNFSEETVTKFRELLPSNWILLNRETLKYEGITYSGATLWTNIAGKDISEFKRYMNDRRKIKFKCRLPMEIINEVNEEHRKDKEFLLYSLNTSDVIISHHSPSFKSSVNNDFGIGCYCNSLDSYIESSSLKAWVHGHLHNKVNYKIGNTFILSNPNGYLSNSLKVETFSRS